MRLRQSAFLGASCITIGWLLASTLTPPVARVQTRPAERVVATPAAPAVPVAPRLQWYPRPTPQPPAGRRNPFVFSSVEQGEGEADASPRVDEPRAFAASEPTAASGPFYTLSGIGIATDARTAVLSNGDIVRIVKVGDVIDGFTVLEITENSVTLTKGDARHVLHLAQ